jgi:Ca2+-binding EF-hand superfamily protein
MLLNRYDADGNGIITFDEFAAMMTNAPQLQ